MKMARAGSVWPILSLRILNAEYFASEWKFLDLPKSANVANAISLMNPETFMNQEKSFQV